MIILCYPGCSTCKKALEWLSQQGYHPDQRNIKEENPTAEEIKKWWKQSQLPLKKLFNTSGQMYRQMELSKKLPKMTEEQQLALLGSNGMLVKRPLLVADGLFLAGFKPAEWEAALSLKENTHFKK